MKKNTMVKRMAPLWIYRAITTPLVGIITIPIEVSVMRKVDRWIDGDPKTVESVANKYRDLVEKYDTAHTDEEKAEAYMGLEALRQALGGKVITTVEGQQILNDTECEITPIEGDEEGGNSNDEE